MSSPNDDRLNLTKAMLARSQGAGGSRRFRGAGVIILFGLPRSGTSWLGKIFDSHPDTLYRHEPDMFLSDDRMPSYHTVGDRDRYGEVACEYLERMIRCNSSHAAGPPPYFTKNYRDPLSRLLRLGILFAVRKVEGVAGALKRQGRIPVPEFVRGGSGFPRCVVIKSITSLGQARLFAEARPETRIIVMLRHPCGQIESMMRGLALGKLPELWPVGLPPPAKIETMGFSRDTLKKLPPVEQLGWGWALWNQTLLDDFGGAERARIIRYEDLAANPEQVTRELFAFAGLSWDPQTAAFLQTSTSANQADSYFRVVRDPAVAASKWRTGLSPEDQDRILGIAEQVPAGRLFAAVSDVGSRAKDTLCM
jgi:sulfotransferase family protein